MTATGTTGGFGPARGRELIPIAHVNAGGGTGSRCLHGRARTPPAVPTPEPDRGPLLRALRRPLSSGSEPSPRRRRWARQPWQWRPCCPGSAAGPDGAARRPEPPPGAASPPRPGASSVGDRRRCASCGTRKTSVAAYLSGGRCGGSAPRRRPAAGVGRAPCLKGGGGDYRPEDGRAALRAAL